MPPTPDYIRILTDAGDRPATDPDIAQTRARMRRARRPGIRSAIRRWLAQAAAPREVVATTPTLHDYPWGPVDRG